MAVTLLTVLAGVLRFMDLGLQSLWIDEALTAWVLDPSPADTFENLTDREATPPLYYVFAWLWTRIFGEGDAALRSLSALFGTATVPAVYLAGRRLASSRAGIVAAALVATSPYLTWYSQEARSYALAMLLAALSLVFLAGAAESRSRRELALWALTCSLLFATHYFSVILIGVEALWLVQTRGIKRETLLAFAGPAATMALLAPLALGQDHATWIEGIDFQSRLDDTARSFVGGFGGAPESGLGLAAGLLVAAGVVLLVWRARDHEQNGGLLALGIAAVAFAAALALSKVGLDYVFHRNLLVLWIPIAIAVAAGFAAARVAGIAGAAALCLVFLWSHFGIVDDEDRHRENWQAAVEELGRSDGPRPIAVWPPYADPELIHYGIPLRDNAGETVMARELVVIGENMNVDALTPGRRLGEFRVAERNLHHSVTTAVLRAAEPQPIKLGVIHRSETLGAPQVNVFLDPGRDAAG